MGWSNRDQPPKRDRRRGATTGGTVYWPKTSDNATRRAGDAASPAYDAASRETGADKRAKAITDRNNAAAKQRKGIRLSRARRRRDGN